MRWYTICDFLDRRPFRTAPNATIKSILWLLVLYTLFIAGSIQNMHKPVGKYGLWFAGLMVASIIFTILLETSKRRSLQRLYSANEPALNEILTSQAFVYWIAYSPGNRWFRNQYPLAINTITPEAGMSVNVPRAARIERAVTYVLNQQKSDLRAARRKAKKDK